MMAPMNVCAAEVDAGVIEEVDAETYGQSGYLDYTNNSVSWSYDAGTKTITITGSGERTGHEYIKFIFPTEAEHVVFKDCSLSGDLSCLFTNMSHIQTIDFSGLSTSNITKMRHMFEGCSSLTSLDLSNFDTSKVTDMYGLFQAAENMTSLNLGRFDTSNVTNMAAMFNWCFKLQNLDVSGFNTSNVTDMRDMFGGCAALTHLDVSNFNTSNVTNMSSMFSTCEKLNDIDVSNFNTSKVTNMSWMFSNCRKLKNIDTSNFDTSEVTNMLGMFISCEELKSIDLSSFNTDKVTDMSKMFYGCINMTDMNVESFDTNKVEDISWMFYKCNKLMDLNIKNFNLSGLVFGRVNKYTDELENPVENVFAECTSLRTIYVPTVMGTATIDLPSTFTDGTVEMSSFDTESEGKFLYKLGFTPTVDVKFADVTAGEWYVSAIQYAYDTGLMTGISDNLFGTNNSLKREQFVQILYSQAGKPMVTTESTFNDVQDKSQWYYSAVVWANANQIVNGIDAGVFGVNQNITREQLALMMYKYAGIKGIDTSITTEVLDSFPDKGSVNDWASQAVQWAVSHGIVSGKPSADGANKIDPQGIATRAECAAMMRKMLTM